MPTKRKEGSSRGCWETGTPLWNVPEGSCVTNPGLSSVGGRHCRACGWGGVRSGHRGVDSRSCPWTRTHCPLYQHVLFITHRTEGILVSVST